MKDKTKTLILFDSHAILHRAYHALPDFSTSKGEPTGALYGLSTMIIKIINEFKPDYMAAAYDLPGPTFRKQIYDEYKSGRSKTDNDLIDQIKFSQNIFSAFDIPVYSKPGFEADDVIGTIVEKNKNEKNLKIIIASGDMDTLQLVEGDRVCVYTLKKGLNDTIVYNQKLVVDRFGFKPDLLPDFKGLRGDPSDNIIGIKGIGEKTASILINNFGTIENIYKKLNSKPEVFKEIGLTERLINLLKSNEDEALFSKTLAIIRKDVPIDFTLPDKVWPETFDIKKVEQLFNDLEFRSLINRVKQVFSYTDSVKKNNKLNLDQEIETRLKIAYWVINSNKTNPTIEEIFSFVDSNQPEEVEKKLSSIIKKDHLLFVYEKIELPLIDILEKAKSRGILVDINHFKNLSLEYHKSLSALETKIWQIANKEFNINSPKQLAEVLFDDLNLKVKGLKKTSTGARSTKESELFKLKDEHQIIDYVLQYREIQKLLTTYIDNIPKLVDKNNYLHSSLNQTGTTTGRMSSNDPNMQNIPVKDSVIRAGFIASPGHVWLAADYSQIEMRILALLSKDENLIKILKEEKDIHQSVASFVFGVKEDNVTKEMRRQAKVINFGIIYGMGVNALKSNLGGSREQAQKFYDDYFKAFPTIKKYFDDVISEAYTKGYTKTYFGRRRYFLDLKSKLPYIRAQAERMAMNAPIQGTAADVVKLAIININNRLIKEKLINKVHLLLQVHDELIYEIDEKIVNKVKNIIKEEMEQVLEDIPLVVNISVGKNWGHLV